MSLLSTPAIVLGGMRLGEADRLVTFFTGKRGRLKGVAKSARRMKNRFGTALEPFTHCNLIIFEKGGDKLGRINHADIIHSYQCLREDWHCIELASQMVDLVNRMTPEGETNHAIFNLLLQGLRFLEKGPDRALSMLLFINRLVIYSGYQPRWDQCLKCQQVFKPGIRQTLYFSPGSGGTICLGCAKGMQPLSMLSQGTRAFLNASQKMDYILSHRLKPSPIMKQEIEALFKDYLSYITGKSRRTFSSGLPSLSHPA